MAANEKIMERVAYIERRIEWASDDLTKAIKELAEYTAKCAVMTEGPEQLKMAAVCAGEHTASTIRRINELRANLDALHEQKGLLEWAMQQ